jgi:hypothetical protein
MKELAEKGYKSVDMFQKLGNAYYFNGNSKKQLNGMASYL